MIRRFLTLACAGTVADWLQPLEGSHAWISGTLQAVDAVTVVARGVTVDQFQILVNGLIVSEQSISACGLKDVTALPLWDVVDVDGACIKVRLNQQVDSCPAGSPHPADLGMCAGIAARPPRCAQGLLLCSCQGALPALSTSVVSGTLFMASDSASETQGTVSTRGSSPASCSSCVALRHSLSCELVATLVPAVAFAI